VKLRILVTGILGGAALAVAVPAAAQDAVAKGVQVYAAQKCSICHAIAGKGPGKNTLDGVGSKLSADDIRQWIVDPKTMTTKTKSTAKPPMKAYTGLAKADLDALVAYMQSLKKK
jgi:mono/diheme cytochrome c family protein